MIVVHLGVLFESGGYRFKNGRNGSVDLVILNNVTQFK